MEGKKNLGAGRGAGGQAQGAGKVDGLNVSEGLDHIKSETAMLRLEMQEFYRRKASEEKSKKYPKSARIPLVLQEHHALRKAAFERHTTMGLLLREETDKYLTAPELLVPE